MKTFTKLALLGGAIAYFARRRRHAVADLDIVDEQPADDAMTETRTDTASDLAAVDTDDAGLQPAEASGISDVDPEPLLDMGEAVDPDAITKAHEAVPSQRDRLP